MRRGWPRCGRGSVSRCGARSASPPAQELPDALDGADGLLIEAKAPPDATRPGGNAVPLDWSLTAGWHAPGPWLLAGGLTPENVGAAIRLSGRWR